MAAPLTRDLKGLAALFTTSGVLHLVRPQPFEAITPRRLPARRGLVYASGVAEIACAAGLLHPRTRRLAGWASAALLVAVFPGNIQMAVDETRRVERRLGSGRPANRRRQLATIARLPLQLPMVRTALKATRDESGRHTAYRGVKLP
ncbi:MAG: DoxX family protein [Oryzihumus sp.]